MIKEQKEACHVPVLYWNSYSTHPPPNPTKKKSEREACNVLPGISASDYGSIK
jgi:hypothetical protein